MATLLFSVTPIVLGVEPVDGDVILGVTWLGKVEFMPSSARRTTRGGSSLKQYVRTVYELPRSVGEPSPSSG